MSIAKRCPPYREGPMVSLRQDTCPRAKLPPSCRSALCQSIPAFPTDGTHANYCDVNCPKALGEDGKNLEEWRKVGAFYIGYKGDFATATFVCRREKCM